MRRLSRSSNLVKVSMAFIMIMSLLSSPIVIAQELSGIDEEDPGVPAINVSESGPATESEESTPGSDTGDGQGNPDAGTDPGSVEGEPLPEDHLSPDAGEENQDVGDGTETQPDTGEIEADGEADTPSVDISDPKKSGDEETTPESQEDNLVEPVSPDDQVVDDADEPDGVGTLTLTIVFEGEGDIIGDSCFEVRQNDVVISEAECLAPDGITDGQGTVMFNALPAGSYTVVGSVVPDGWTSSGPVENVVVATEQNATASLTLTAEQGETGSITTLAEPTADGGPMTIRQRMCLGGLSGGDCNRNNGMGGFSTTFTITGPGPEDVQTTTVVIGAFGTPDPINTGQRVIRDLPAGTYTVCQELVATVSGPPFPDFHTGPSTATLISLDGPCQTNTLPAAGGGGQLWLFHNQVDVLTSSETGELWITKYVCEDAALGGTAEIVWRQPSHCGPPVTSGFNLDVQRNGVSVLPPGHDLLIEFATLEIGTYTLVEDGVPVAPFSIGAGGLSLNVINYVGPDTGEVSLAKYLCEDEALAGTSAVVATAPADCGAPVSAGYLFDIVDSGGVSVLPAGSDLLAAPVTVPVGTGYQMMEDGLPLGVAFDVTTAGVSFIVVNYVVPNTGEVSLAKYLCEDEALAGTAAVVATAPADCGAPVSTGYVFDIVDSGGMSVLPAGSDLLAAPVNVPVGTGYQLTEDGTPLGTTFDVTIAGVSLIVVNYVAPPDSDPTFVLNSTSGPAGVVVRFTGTEFVPGERVEIWFGGSNGRLVGYRTATANGSIGGAITIPADSSVGDHQVVAIGVSGRQADAIYEVVPSDSDPTLVLESTSGPAGVVVRFTGTELVPGERVEIWFGGTNGRLVGYRTALANGSIGGAITIPVGTGGGTHQVVAIGASGRQANAIYEVAAPTLVLNSSSGPAGVVVRFTGTGFVPGERVNIHFGGSNGRLVGYRTALANGSIGGAITIPADSSVGDHQVVATGVSGRQADAVYEVVAPTLALNSTSGPAGVVVRFTGTGFVPGERVNIHFGGSNGRLVGYKTSSADGSISGAITIPASTGAGTHQVVANGVSGKQANAVYEVTSGIISIRAGRNLQDMALN